MSSVAFASAFLVSWKAFTLSSFQTSVLGLPAKASKGGIMVRDRNRLLESSDGIHLLW